MKIKKSRSSTVLKKLIGHLILSLTELTEECEISAFAEGEIIAFVECLEVTSQWKKYKKYGIEDIEKRFLKDN